MEKKREYFYRLFYIFLFGCFFGWICEVIWSFYRRGMFINHSALVIGPFNMIYGLGAAFLSLILNKFKDKNIFYIFVISFIGGSILEYIASFLMEKAYGFVAWDYSKKFMNLNGRICLKYSIFWGLIGIIWIKLIFPKLTKMIDKISFKFSKIFIKIMIVFLILDGIFTLMCVKRGKEFDKNIAPQNNFEKFIDKYFGVDYLNNMFNNRWYKVK